MKKKKAPKRLSKITLVALLALSGYFSWTFVSSIMEQKRLKANLSQVQQELSVLKRTNESLNDQRTKLNDPEYMKEYARGNFMFSGSDEQIFILPSKKDK